MPRYKAHSGWDLALSTSWECPFLVRLAVVPLPSLSNTETILVSVPLLHEVWMQATCNLSCTCVRKTPPCAHATARLENEFPGVRALCVSLGHAGFPIYEALSLSVLLSHGLHAAGIASPSKIEQTFNSCFLRCVGWPALFILEYVCTIPAPPAAPAIRPRF